MNREQLFHLAKTQNLFLLLLIFMLVVIQDSGYETLFDAPLLFGPTDYHALSTYGNLPLTFEPNQGQVDSDIQYLSRSDRYSLFFEQDKIQIIIPPGNEYSTESPKEKTNSESLGIQLVDIRPSVSIQGESKQKGKTNYLIGNDPQKWITDIPNYSQVRYCEIYDGIDLVLYGNQRQLEFDYVVKPGAALNLIRFELAGVTDIELTPRGELEIKLDTETITLDTPLIYQLEEGEKSIIEGSYALIDETTIGFHVGEYDQDRNLIIDPVLVYSTEIAHGSVRALAVDKDGHAFITGRTANKSYPVTKNAYQRMLEENNSYFAEYDVFVTKLNAEGTGLIYSTFLGGSLGNDEAFDIALDDEGNAYVTGVTYSSNFPVTEGAIKTNFNEPGTQYTSSMWNLDAFVAKLDTSGSNLIYSTYLGGENEDYAFGIDVDVNGHAYVAGLTASEHFPTTSGAMYETAPGGRDRWSPTRWNKNDNGFVSKLSPDGTSLAYSTFIAHPDTSWGTTEWVIDVAVDTDGNAYITGNGYLSASRETSLIFAAKLNSTGSAFHYTTQIGPDGIYGKSQGIDVDDAGNAYIVGSVSSLNFVTTNGFQTIHGDPTDRTASWGDAFLSMISPTGTSIPYSTFIGGRKIDKGFSVAVGKSGLVSVVGYTASDDFPIKEATQSQLNNGTPQDYYGDAFVITVDPRKSGDESLIFSSFLGGMSDDGQDAGVPSNFDGGYGWYPEREISRGGGIDVDAAGNVYVGGYDRSSDFPTTPDAYRKANAAIYVTKIGHHERIHQLIYDQVESGGPPVFSRTATVPQQILPQYILQSHMDTVKFEFEGRTTDGKVALRVSNTRITGFTFPPLDLTRGVIIRDPDGEEVSGFTLFNIGNHQFGRQFEISKNGTWTILVSADSTSDFPAPFQIHLAGNVGLPSERDFPRAIRHDILFNHPAPRPQGIYGSADTVAQTALFKYANPVVLSPFAVAVIVPHQSNGVPPGSTIVRAPDPMTPLHITTPTARTPAYAGVDIPGTIIDFTQIPDPAITAGNLNESICAVLGANDGSVYTLSQNENSSALIFDMGSGQEIVDGPGADFTVYASSGSYSVAVSNTPFTGTFRPVNDPGNGTQNFDITSTGLTVVRYVLITSTAPTAVDAVKALRMFCDNIITDPVTGNQVLTTDFATSTITMQRAKSPEGEFDPFLELIAPDGMRVGENESGFGDKTSLDLSDAALISQDLTQSGFYRFLARGYHQIPGDQSSGAFFVRLESGGLFADDDIVVSQKSEVDLLAQATGSISLVQQRDSYRFQWHPGQAVKITANARDNAFDPVLELYDPEGFLIASNDNYPRRGHNAVLNLTLPMNSFNSGEALPDPGSYRIVVRAVDRASDPQTRGDLELYKRSASGGTYELRVFTGELGPGEPLVPQIAQITPRMAIPGTQDLHIAIYGENFESGATVGLDGSGIVIENVTVVDSQKITMQVDIGPDVSPGRYDVNVTNPNGESATAVGGLTIRDDLGPVTLTWDPPSSGNSLAPPENLTASYGDPSTGMVSPVPSTGLQASGNPGTILTDITEIEPNDFFEESQAIDGISPLSVTGNIETDDGASIVLSFMDEDGNVYSDDLEDIYQVTLRGDQLKITLHGFSSDCDLYLFDATMFPIDHSANRATGTQESIQMTELQAGVYYVGVAVYDDTPASTTSPYTLTIEGQFQESQTSQLGKYKLYRSISGNAKETGEMVAEIDAGKTGYTDAVPFTGNFYYQITAVYDQQESEPSNDATVLVTRIDKKDQTTASEFSLLQNYPNPFNPMTTIPFSVAKTTRVRLKVYDIQGRLVQIMTDRLYDPGFYTLPFDATNLATGIYFYQIEMDGFQQVRKMVFVE